MYTIEVDFEVLKALMALRHEESVSNNDVTRNLLKLGTKKDGDSRKNAAAPDSSHDWLVKGIRFPAGSEFRSVHHGKHVSAKVANGALVLEGKSYNSPSAAAQTITGYAVNGWAFWECRTPGTERWKEMSTFRPDNR